MTIQWLLLTAVLLFASSFTTAKQKIKALPSDQVLDLVVGLPIRNQADLEQEIADIHNPNSDKYGKYGNPQLFLAKYGPAQDQVDLVTSFLKNHSLNVKRVTRTNLFVSVEGKAGDLNAAFQVELNLYLDDDGVTTYFDTELEPNLPQGVMGIVGLRNRTRIRRIGSTTKKTNVKKPNKKKKKKKAKKTKAPTKYPTATSTTMPTPPTTTDANTVTSANPTTSPTTSPTISPTTSPILRPAVTASPNIATSNPTPPTSSPIPPTSSPIPPTSSPIPPTTSPIPPTSSPIPPTSSPTYATSAPTMPTPSPTRPTPSPTAPTRVATKTPTADQRLTSITPSDLRTAYSIGSTYTGTGQIGGLYELDTYYQSDINEYTSTYGLPSVPLVTVCLSGSDCPNPGSGVVEVTLDIDLMIATAPGLTSIHVYEAQNTLTDGLLLYDQMATDNIVNVISSSWGLPEDEAQTSYFELEANAFMQMAYNGQSMFAASGDSGAFADGTNVGVQDPASQAYVTGVGGTKLYVSSTDGTYYTETTWWDGSAKAGGGGGGISSYVSIPSYQQLSGVVNPANSASSVYRNVPDVSLNAEPSGGYIIYLGNIKGDPPGWYLIGGTSCASPIWAGFAACVNQQLVSNSQPVLGQFNTKLYPLALSSNYNEYFHDINDGSTNGYIYEAVTGYDLCTGWGSMQGNALLEAF